MAIKPLLIKIKEKNPDVDLELVKRAYDFASQAHAGQKRQSGEEYILHPIRVANILTDFSLDTNTIVAALLHDVLEDTNTSPETIKKEFGKDITNIVQGLTKINKIQYQGSKRYAENLKKMILALSDDARVAFIKLADRLDNLKSIDVYRQEKKERKARETLEIYAPIADRLGMSWLKGELEDLAFPIVYPKEYSWLMANITEKYRTRKAYLKRIAPKIQKYIEKEGIKIIDFDYRAKHYWSLYQKLKRYDMDINKIYDLVAMRIIVPTVEDCYAVLGIIHKYWNPLIGRIKDYIAMPKPNGYQSIHTTVFCDNGIITEFQIRTPEMHRKAEYGIAAHWYYSEKKGFKSYLKKISTKAPEKKLIITKQIKEFQDEIKKSDPKDLFQKLRVDFFKTRIFVFTPKGDSIELPEKSCPIDFAYAIHSDLGNHCSQAIINGSIKSLYHQLENGDIVDIKIDKNRKPSPDWINFVRTQKARSEIRKNTPQAQEKIEKKISIKPILELPKKIFSQIQSKKKYPILIEGQDRIETNFGKCCNPQPGDKIVGYITKNNGVSIHKPDCINFKKACESKPSNIVSATWK
ncbi:MAG TPA: RelA/SpoT family protein [Candidatus Pacearchaeota archaeon]|nr:RelA/SpoT family protein [Candidatus Pacearchaeota archaeon]HOU45552.1 RelA/SpoT family protein [Candidatus Pacearchaeota archaeon]HPM08415.1 RelA/SpoT family protein [Candidatus Pacearchaeota archaeon]HQI74291.1 RelA/SpoT family protein [Candidatus Pacearchaeota archaeon]